MRLLLSLCRLVILAKCGYPSNGSQNAIPRVGGQGLSDQSRSSAIGSCKSALDLLLELMSLVILAARQLNNAIQWILLDCSVNHPKDRRHELHLPLCR